MGDLGELMIQNPMRRRSNSWGEQLRPHMSLDCCQASGARVSPAAQRPGELQLLGLFRLSAFILYDSVGMQENDRPFDLRAPRILPPRNFRRVPHLGQVTTALRISR